MNNYCKEDADENDGDSISVDGKRTLRVQLLLDAIIGEPLSLLLHADTVDQVRAVVRGASSSASNNTTNNDDSDTNESDDSNITNTNTGAV